MTCDLFKELFNSTGFSKKAAASKPAKNPLGMIMDVAKQKKAQLVKQEKEMRTTMVVSKAKSEFKSLGDGKCFKINIYFLKYHHNIVAEE